MVDQVAGFTQYHNGGQDPIYGVHIDMSNKGQMMRYNNTKGPSVVSCHAAAHSGQQTFSKRFCKYVQFVSDFLGEIYNLISLLCNFYFFNVHCECKLSNNLCKNAKYFFLRPGDHITPLFSCRWKNLISDLNMSDDI